MSSGHPHGHGSGKRLFSIGLVVAAVLAALTVIEYIISQEVDANLAPLFGIAIVKVVLILWYFMHVARSWAHKEES